MNQSQEIKTFKLDTPIGNKIGYLTRFSGWYITQNNQRAKLQIIVDGKPYTFIVHGSPRPDVAEYTNNQGALFSGFWAELSLPRTREKGEEIDIQIVEECVNGSLTLLFNDKYVIDDADENISITYPHPPSQLLERISGDASVDAFISSFPNLRKQVKQYLSLAGFEFSQFEKILDMGCGVGRFLFAFQPELTPHQSLWACDVYEECARWCKENVNFAKIEHTDINPPLPYRSNQFDLVYALSVFTHLRLDLQFRWVWELYRILHPGGVLFCTIHGISFFPLLYDISRSGVNSAKMYSFNEDGLFSYLDREGLEEDQGQIDITSAHSHAFVKYLFAPFQYVKHFPISKLAGGQDLYIFRKPTGTDEIAHAINETIDSVISWEFHDNFQVSSGKSSLEMSFNLTGQRIFHVYVQVKSIAVYSIEFGIDISDNQREILAQKKVLLHNNPISAKTHYSIIEVHIPKYIGLVYVSLNTKIINDSVLFDDESIDTVWSFPYFASKCLES